MASVRAAVSLPVASAFIVATDLEPHHPVWKLAELQLRDVAASLAPILGFLPELRLARMDESMINGIESAREVFVLPA
jgi:hypothetical protein